MRRAAAWSLTCVLVLAGCATTGTGGSASGSSAAPVSPSVEVTVPASPGRSSPPPASRTAGTLVEFRRQGGFAGLSDQLVVHGDGTFYLVRAKPPVSRQGQLTGAELTDLQLELAHARLAPHPTAPPGAKGSDLFVYVVDWDRFQVVTQDGSVPPALNPLLSTLSGLVTRYGT
jgi:hypothetical protein